MVAFKTFPFKSLIMMCLSMNLFQFILWEVILAFWVCRFCLLHRFWKFTFIISLNSVLSLSLSFYCGSPLIQAYFLQALDTVIFFFFGGGGGNLFYFSIQIEKIWISLQVCCSDISTINHIQQCILWDSKSYFSLLSAILPVEVYQIRSGCVQVQLPLGPYLSHLAKVMKGDSDCLGMEVQIAISWWKWGMDTHCAVALKSRYVVIFQWANTREEGSRVA